MLQVGDRVKLTDNALHIAPKNMPSRFGKIVGLDDEFFEVALDGCVTGHAGNSNDDRVHDRWYLLPEDLEPATRQRPSIASDIALKPQAKSVLRHLEREGRISPMKALMVYGISRLAACIWELREAGYKIDTARKVDASGHHYASYALK